MRAAQITLVTVALVALGVWMGGMIALGAIAAPVVFKTVPAPTNADAMTVVFRRFDTLALACVALAGLVEVALAVLRRGRFAGLELARGGLVAVAGAAVLYVALAVSPRIEALHRAGAVRGQAGSAGGAGGAELDAIHATAERAGKLGLALGVALIALHAAGLARLRGSLKPD